MLSADAARRLALVAQGVAKPPSGRAVTRAHFRRVMQQMAVLQLDSVNVLCRSHFLPVFSRLGAYDRDRLDAWLWQSGENVEFLAHEAALTSRADYDNLRFRLEQFRYKGYREFAADNAGYLDAVMQEVVDGGAQSVRTLNDPGNRTGPWWGMPRGKIALECLFGQGRLAIARRCERFITWYDVPERVLGETGPAPAKTEQQRALLLRAAGCLGVGTLDDLADYFRLSMPVARPLVAQLCEDGALQEVAVSGWDRPGFMLPGTSVPRKVRAECFLSPFDPVVWYRPRAQRLFDFHYRIEIYVPEAKRQFGYYVLPFLLGDRLQGRADLRADRAESCLVVPGVYAEAGADPEPLAAAMARQLRAMAGWLGLETVVVSARDPFARQVADAVAKPTLSEGSAV